MPEVTAHLEDLGVELPAVTFGWFLSLFTDSLPIQVSADACEASQPSLNKPYF